MPPAAPIARFAAAAAAPSGLARRRGGLTPARLAVTLTLVMVVSAALVLGRGSGRSGSSTFARHLMPWLDQTAERLGLGLDQVEVAGLRQASAADILDAADLPNVRSYFSFDLAQVKARIERVAWVDTATIERRFPNRLAITVTERRPLAVWDRGRRDALIDSAGRQLAVIARGAVADLPRIAGEGAALDAGRLLALVASYPEIAAQLNLAERIGGRRWRLHLASGMSVDLPAEADASALAMLVEPGPSGRLIDVMARRIDLTLLRRVVIEPMPSPTGRS